MKCCFPNTGKGKNTNLSRLDNICTSGKVGEKWETLKGNGFSVSDFGQLSVKLWPNFSAKPCENALVGWGAAAAGPDDKGGAE